jgi:disulfide bond formation protein DsbB
MQSLFERPAAVMLLVAGVSLAAIGAALVSQHVFDMQPCPWCVLQRVVFAAIALVALAGAWLPQRLAKAGALLATGLLAADRIVSGLQLDALAPEVFAPRASCADAAVNLLGLPYEFWSLGLFAALGAAAAWTMVRLWAPASPGRAQHQGKP